METKEIKDIISATQNFKLALIYSDNNDKNTKQNIKKLKKILEKYEDNQVLKQTLKENEKLIKTYYINTDEAPEKDLKKYAINKDGTYTILANGEILKTLDSETTIETIDKYLGLITNTNVDKEFLSYKVAGDANEFTNLIKRKNDITIAIFGRNNCYYCNQYLPVYNTIAEENNLDIYYFDSMSYDKDEFTKVLNSGLKVPAACNKNVEIGLNELTNTPLTLFIKDNKSIDCIAGYVSKSVLITKLQTLGLIKIEK